MSRVAEQLPLQRHSPTWELLVLAVPIVGMTTTRMLMGFIDFVMVSKLGTEAQAAISPASILVFTVACLGMGTANGVQTFVAQSLGRGRPREAGSYAWQAFYLAGVFALLSLPLCASVPWWFRGLARLGEHPAAAVEMEIAYLRIAFLMLPAATLSVGLDGFFSGVHRPWISFVAALCALAVNALGNWLLIFGHCGFPEMGIAGAAVATVIGWWVRAAVLTVAFLHTDYAAPYNTRHGWAFHWERMRGVLRVGGPTAVQWLVDIGSWVVFMVVMMPPFGLATMAASNVGLQCMHFSFMPAVGIGIALCSQVGHAIGAGDQELAKVRARVALRLTILYMGAVGVLFCVARRQLMWLFNDDPAVIEAGSWILIWAGIFQVFDAMGITYMNALRGAGDTRWPAVVTFALCWGVFVSGGYAVARLLPQFGLNGPWFACTLYIVLLGLLLGWRWQAGHWRSIRLFHEPAVTQAVEPPDEAPMAAVTAVIKVKEPQTTR